MEYIIRIRNVDDDARKDIEYILNRHFSKIEGIKNDKEGCSIIGFSTERVEVKYSVERTA